MTRRYHTLDAMRGIAALAVVCMHVQAHGLGVGLLSFRKGYLAVDFFFMLSGLVISHAYAVRLASGRLTFGHFFLLRVIRLYPLYLLGTLIGLALILLAMHGGNLRVNGADLVGAIVAALLMLPSPFVIEARGSLMPFNVAGWSLLFEVAVNLIYAAIHRRCTRPVLIGVVLLAGITLAAQTIAHGGTDVGSRWDDVWLGIARTAFSFFLGVLIGRATPAEHRRTWTAWLLPVPLLAVFMLGARQGASYDLVCVLLVFPLLLLVGARIEPPRAGLFAFLGLISFSIYAVHAPLLSWIDVPIRRRGIPFGHVPLWVAPVVVMGLVLFAWGADRLYDRPVRNWLGQRLGTPHGTAA